MEGGLMRAEERAEWMQEGGREGGRSLGGECRHDRPMRGGLWKPLLPSSHPYLFTAPDIVCTASFSP